MYEINAFFWYKALFMAELIAAECIMCHRLRPRSHIWLRLGIVIPVLIGIAFAVPVFAYNVLYCSLLFLFLFAVTIFAVRLCVTDGWATIVFCCIAAYSVQHIAFEALSLVGYIFGLPSVSAMYGDQLQFFFVTDIYGGGVTGSFFSNPLLALIYLFIYGVTYWLGFMFSAKLLSFIDQFVLKASGLLIGLALAFVFNILLGALVIYNSDAVGTLGRILCSIYSISSCAFILFTLFHVVFRQQLERENAAMEKMRLIRDEQYDRLKENINLINIKCHDIKHQLRNFGIRNEMDASAISEMEELISVYDTRVKTGHAALDTILTEKSLYCLHHGIVLSCIADGGQLSFMSETDVYSLFGNAVDNAIEAVSRLPDTDRVIDLSVKRVNGFVMIRICNTFDGVLVMEDGLPLTSKSDKNEHGYGLRSIRRIVEKYGGEMRVGTENGAFVLTTVFPTET